MMAAVCKAQRRGLLLAGALLLACLAGTASAQSATLIVEFSRHAVSTASAAATDTPAAIAAVAAAADAAAVAVAAAEQRGASAEKQAAIAAMASETAYAIPAVAAIASLVSVAAASSGIEVVGQTSYTTVFRGAALKTRSAADAQRLKEQLEQNPAVHRVWYAVSGFSSSTAPFITLQDCLTCDTQQQ
jgi:hypothetical protein